MSGETILLLVWTLIITVIMGAYMSEPEPFKTCKISEPEYKSIMKYHGTQILYEGYNGDIWFMRDGKKIYIVKGKPDGAEQQE